MPENKHATHTDLAKLDAHEIQPEEYDDIPELTDEFFEKAEIRHGDRIIRPGRPPLDFSKKLVSLRLDQNVIDAGQQDLDHRRKLTVDRKGEIATHGQCFFAAGKVAGQRSGRCHGEPPAAREISRIFNMAGYYTGFRSGLRGK